MEKISLPSTITVTPGEQRNEAVISIQPCFPGYGTTLGNALRRVMLSSLPGGAVTSFKVKGVSHEFTTVPNVKEDVVEITLNLKQLNVKVYSTEPVRLKLKAKGEKEVTGKDIEKNADVEVVNPDLVIATLTSKDAELEMELVVNQGRGYVPTEAKEKENTETDMIVIDSIYTPIRNVGFRVENVRVGQMTNYESLVMTVETDGTITPEEALSQANQVLIDHFNFIAEQAPVSVVSDEPVKKTVKKRKSKADKEAMESEMVSEEEKE